MAVEEVAEVVDVVETETAALVVAVAVLPLKVVQPPQPNEEASHSFLMLQCLKELITFNSLVIT